MLEAVEREEEMMDKKNIKRIIVGEMLIMAILVVFYFLIVYIRRGTCNEVPHFSVYKKILDIMPIAYLSYLFIRFIIWAVKKSRRQNVTLS